MACEGLGTMSKGVRQWHAIECAKEWRVSTCGRGGKRGAPKARETENMSEQAGNRVDERVREGMSVAERAR